jgi:hypothetical protein
MAANIKPFQDLLTPSPIKNESALVRFIREAKENGITPDPSTLSILAAADAFGTTKVPGFSEPGGEREKLDYWTQKQKEQADYRQQLGEQSTKKALMYSTIAKLPQQMANAFSPYGGQTGALMAYEGMSRIPEIYRNTLASTPQMNISVPGYSAQQPRYFS